MTQEHGIYLYQPSHVLPAVFAGLIGISFMIHIYQNFRYRFWKVTFFMFYGGAVFTTGWIMRCVSSYNTTNLNFYIVQTVFILAGPPIYSAAEYNVLGRLMNYVPMYAPLNPNRVIYFFIYLGVAVESLTSAGASMYATAHGDPEKYVTGGTLISIALVLQAVIECIFFSLVVITHRRCARANMLPRNVRMLCIMLYGTSTLILIRCIARAIDSFSADATTNCNAICRLVEHHEWYLYVFEAAPMVVYTYWLNIVHPGRFLPSKVGRYLDVDGKTERLGPGWIDRRSKVETFFDPFDLVGRIRDLPNYEKFWLQPEKWSVASDGFFANGTASNIGQNQKMATATTTTTTTTTTKTDEAVMKA